MIQKQKRHRRALNGMLALLVLIVLGILFWWAFWRSESVIESEPLRRGDVELAVTASGVLQPHRYVDIGAQVSGQIKRIVVKAGDKVQQGDLLVEIDPALQQATVQADRATLASLQAQLAEQEAQLDLARQRHERQQQMAADGSTRLEDVQTAQANLRIAHARVASLRAQIKGAESTLQGNEALLGYTRIYAPMAGTVVTLDAREGQTLNATYQTPTIMRIADLSRMTVWTEVSEADVGRVRAGMPTYFTTLGLQDETGRPRRWDGTLRQVLPAPPRSSNADSDGGQGQTSTVVSYTALFDVDNPDGALMPQMSARVFFVSAEARDVLLVPLSVMTPKDDADTFGVQVLKNGNVQQHEVRVGVRDRLHAEVLSGLAEGDALVTGITQVQGAGGLLRW